MRGSERWLVTGVTSIHGWPVFRALEERYGKNAVIGVRPPKAAAPVGRNVRPHCLGDRVPLERLRDSHRPQVVIHAGGVCDLDVCEARPAWARQRNVEAARAIMEVFGEDAFVLYLSTDLVFSGRATPEGGYREGDATDPISVVGRTYAEAERIVLAGGGAVLRLGLPIGGSVQGSKGAADWIESRFKKGRRATLFHDEYRSCIACEDVAGWTIDAALLRLEGIHHLGGPVAVSLYEMGRNVLERGNYPPHLLRGRLRREERGGPPRIGNVALNSTRLESRLGRSVPRPIWDAV